MHLRPHKGFRRASAGHELLDLESGLAQLAQVGFDAVADGLLDGAVHVLAAVGERQPREDAAGLGVRVGRAVALEGLVDDEAVAADRDVRRALVEDVVGVEAGLLGGQVDVRAEVVLEPLEHGPGGDQRDLDRVLAWDDAVGVAAEEAGAGDGVGRLSGHDVRGAGHERHLARAQDVEADLAVPGVAAALGHGSAGDEVEGLGRGLGQAADEHAQVVDHGGELVEHIPCAGLFVEVDGPAAVVAVVVHAVGGGVDVLGPLAGQLEGQPVRRVDQAVGLVVGLALVLAQPCGLEGEPLGGRGQGAASGVAPCGRLRVDDAGGLLGGADVHPHDRRAQSFAAMVEGDDGHRRRVVGDTLDLVRLDAGALHDAVDRGAQGVPPVDRRLLGPARRRMGRRVGRRREGDGRAVQIEDPHSARLRAEVDAHDVRTAGQGVGVGEDGQENLRVESCWCVIMRDVFSFRLY